ncbi:GNAT family N-acetyltransferase [Micromonospora sp. NPDC000316]|uniref:GNAT family N-acetyltransferase n=1 Tax=Micromonospora sp. NPDC000316 TaxID=3364216 RepID=UPI0036B1876E
MASLDTVLAAHRAYLLGWNVGEPSGPDLVTYRSDVPHAPLNGVLRSTGRTPREALAEARRRLDGVPRLWWVGPDSDGDLADGLVSLGAVEVAQMPIMTVEIGDVVDAPTPAGLHISLSTDLEAFVAAYARVSGIPADGVAAVIDREKAFTGNGTVLRLAGHLDGQIVGTAVAWMSHDMLTLYFVGTQPEQRRRGIGAAMTRAALDLAGDRGLRTVALTSTPVAEPVYRRLGFRTAGTFRLLTF